MKKTNWTNLPGLDVVWFSNPGSALVTRMSRVVAVSAVSGVAVDFKFLAALAALYLPSSPTY